MDLCRHAVQCARQRPTRPRKALRLSDLLGGGCVMGQPGTVGVLVMIGHAVAG